MVSFSELLQRIYDELRLVADDNTQVTEPRDHVGVLSRTKDIETPFFGFEWMINPDNRGLSGNVRPGQITEDQNGNIDTVEKVRDYIAFIDIGVVVDNDRPRRRDELLDVIQSHFADFVVDPSKLNNDVIVVEEDGAVPSQVGDDRDAGFRVTYRIEFCTRKEIDIPAAENVLLDVDADGQDAYPEKY